MSTDREQQATIARPLVGIEGLGARVERKEGDRMYGVARRWQADASTLQDFAKRIQRVVPELEQIPGFVSFSVMIANDTLISTTLCEDKEAADQSTALARRYSLDEWTDLQLSQPEVVSGEIAVYASR